MTDPDKSINFKKIVTTIVSAIAVIVDIAAFVEKFNIWAIVGLVVSVIGSIFYILFVKRREVLFIALLVVVVVAGILVTVMVWPPQVTGTAFVDSNRNGNYDTGEMPAVDLKLELEDSKGGLAYAVTDARGTFTFVGVRKGSYTIRVGDYTYIGEIGLLELEEKVGIPIVPTNAPSPTVTPPPPPPCPYQGMTDNETIVNLIQEEAIASNAEDISVMQTIFDPEALFYDFKSDSPTPVKGPLARYQDDLFKTTDFMDVEHFDILPASPGISGDTAYYTSGSKGYYRIGGGEMIKFFNGSTVSIPSTPYGSEHWILKKNSRGCWIITQMEFNAGHVKFPK